MVEFWAECKGILGEGCALVTDVDAVEPGAIETYPEVTRTSFRLGLYDVSR
jgi:hypothetical protein